MIQIPKKQSSKICPLSGDRIYESAFFLRESKDLHLHAKKYFLFFTCNVSHFWHFSITCNVLFLAICYLFLSRSTWGSLFISFYLSPLLGPCETQTLQIKEPVEVRQMLSSKDIRESYPARNFFYDIKLE